MKRWAKHTSEEVGKQTMAFKNISFSIFKSSVIIMDCSSYYLFKIFSLCLNVPFGLTIKRTEGRYIQYMAEWRGITLNYITLLYITHTYKRRAPIKPTINETFQNIFHSFGSNISHPHPYVFLNFQIKIQKTNWHSNKEYCNLNS